ncbi:hypothetical protein [Roseisolibacter agri]|uniref:Uncharacterized protein n=1 Tax=Roseisolibacter agri TaxID=2014610 RepID=A0AA37V1A4_9BACT|nr:hypothetical protein [Roseisolibacter agri]GLC25870.1 hypothetical protein rosag_23830 [Roseisolibacter agri]
MSARRIVESALRAGAVGALALAAWQRLAPAPAAAQAAASADERALAGALARWTTEGAPAARVALDTLPDARTRDWLRALDAAGTRVSWRATRAPALATAAEPAREPAGGVQLAVAAPDGAPLAARDALGALDSVRAADGGARLALPSVGAGLQVRTVGGIARLDAPRPVDLDAVLVLARAGWEGKFTVAALEEAGWRVRARFALGPGMVVAQDGAAAGTTALDTATLAAVVALDSSAAALAGPIAGYVRRGGGLVLAGEAARVPALAALAAAALDDPVRDGDGTVRALTAPRADAVPLAWRPLAGRRALVAAARRVGPGRVVQLAEEETWRRRLAGGEEAPAAHRAFWSRAVATVAHASAAPTPSPPPASPLDAPAREPAPLAATVAALGPPTTGAARDPGGAPAAPAPRRVPDAVLVGGALAALLAEVASRRLRGAA